MTSRAIPDWDGTLATLVDSLKDILFTIRMGKESGVETDILTLEAFDQLDRFMTEIKQEMGI